MVCLAAQALIQRRGLNSKNPVLEIPLKQFSSKSKLTSVLDFVEYFALIILITMVQIKILIVQTFL